MFNFKSEEQRVTLEKTDLIALVNYCLQKGVETKAQIPEHLNIKQLSSYLNYSEPAIYRMVAHSEIPCYKISGKLLFRRKEIDNGYLSLSNQLSRLKSQP